MTGLKRILHSRRGFTLVELVVVLVILGVTASVGVPALTGYIDNAKEKQAVSETQACVETATRLAAAKYAEYQHASLTPTSTGTTAETLSDWHDTVGTAQTVTTGTVALTEGSGMYYLNVPSPAPDGASQAHDVAADAGVSGHVSQLTCNANGQVLYLVYTSADGIQVVYTAAGTAANVKDNDDGTIVVPKPDDTKPDPEPPSPNPEPEPDPDPTLSVTIYKKDANDTNTDVIGAQLSIQGSSNTFNIVSKAGGNQISLKVGHYTLTETAAPDDYDIASPITFDVVETNGVLHVSGDSSYVSATGSSVTMYDKKTTVNPIPDFDTVSVTIHLEDGVTKSPMTNLSFKMYPIGHEEEAFTVETDSNGNIVLPIHHSTANPNTDFVKYSIQEYWSYTLVEESAPAGYQALQKVAFGFQLKYDSYDPHKINTNASGSSNKFNGEYLTGGDSAPVLHIQRFPIPMLHIRKINQNGIRLSGGEFEILTSQWNGSLFKSFTSNSSKDYDLSYEVKLHDGDGITSNQYIDISHSNYSGYLQESIAPTGYQKATVGFNFTVSSTTLYSDNYECTPDIKIDWWNSSEGNNNYRIESDSRPLHHVITIIDQPEDPTSTESTCAVNISKMVYKTSSDTTQVLMPSDLKAILRLTGPGVYEEWATDGNVKTFNLLPGTYKLQEVSTPNGYLTAMPISFTVKDTDTSLDVSMLDLTTDDETDKPVFPVDDVIVTLEPKSWAHKLTHDGVDKNGNGKLSFNKELLIWNGDLYYNYEYDDAYTKNLKNTRQEEFDTFFNTYGVMPSNAPDPITFMNKLGIDGNKYLIKLSGNFYLWDGIQPPVASLSKGDVLIVPVTSGDEKYKAYIYKADTSLVITNSNSSGKPYDNGKDYVDDHSDSFTKNIGSSYISFN